MTKNFGSRVPAEDISNAETSINSRQVGEKIIILKKDVIKVTREIERSRRVFAGILFYDLRDYEEMEVMTGAIDKAAVNLSLKCTTCDKVGLIKYSHPRSDR